VPVVAVLAAAFQRLRRPHELAILGEQSSFIQITLRRAQDFLLCAKKDTELSAQRRKRFVPAEAIQTLQPGRLSRRSTMSAAVPYGLALAVGITSTVLIALVVVTFATHPRHLRPRTHVQGLDLTQYSLWNSVWNMIVDTPCKPTSRSGRRA
jgi:hypothetical protein